MNTQGFDRYLSTRMFGSLNGLRFLCILAVLWHHSPALHAMLPAPLLLSRGFLGVDLFFVLSGYLITHLLIGEERRNGRFSLANFYWRRLLRIVPVYYFVLTAVCAYYIVIKGQHQYLELVPYYYLFLSNFLVEDIPLLGITWSLSVEEQYYMLWPAALLLLPRRYVLPALGCVILLNVVAVTGALRGIGIVPVPIGPLLLELPTATYAPILIGSALAILLSRRAVFEALSGILARRGSAPLALIWLVLVLAILPNDVLGWPNLVVHLSMAALLATLVMREDNGLARPLGWAPIARVGEISYGIYLYHLIGLDVAHRLVAASGLADPGAWWVTLVYTILSVAISEVSFRTLEAYFRQFRNKQPWRARPA